MKRTNQAASSTTDSQSELSPGHVWQFSVIKVNMEAHHVRFEKAASECDSETSWFSYASSSIGMNTEDFW